MSVDIPHHNWWLAAAGTQVGDMLTTAYGLIVFGETEQNPLMQAVFDLMGLVPGLIVTKLLLFTLAVGFYRTVPDSKWTIPAILTVIGGLTVALNLIQIVLVA